MFGTAWEFHLLVMLARIWDEFHLQLQEEMLLVLLAVDARQGDVGDQVGEKIAKSLSHFSETIFISFSSSSVLQPPWEKAVYERADIIFVVARPMVGVSLYVVQVLYHVAENYVVVLVVAKHVNGGIVTWRPVTEQQQYGRLANWAELSLPLGSLSESQMRLGTRRPCVCTVWSCL